MKQSFRSLLIILIFSIHSAQAQNPLWIHYRTSDGLPGNKIYQLSQAPDNAIWIATNKGISKFEGTAFRNFSTLDGLPTNDVFTTYTDATGRTWLSDFSSELHYLKNDSLHKIYGPQFNGAEKSVISYSGNDNYTCVRYSNNFGPARLYAYHDSLFRNPFYDSVVAVSDIDSVLFCDLKLAVLQDANRLLLVKRSGGTWSFRLSQQTKTNITVYNSKFGPFLFHNRIFFQIDHNSFFYIDALRLDTGRLQLPTSVNHILSYRLPGNKMSVSFATNTGLITFDTSLHITNSFCTADPFERPDVSDAMKDNSGNIWVSSRDNGIYMLPFFYKDVRLLQLPSNAGIALKCARTRKGIYFLNNAGNLLLFKDGRFRRIIYLPDETLPGRMPENITLSPDNYGGLYVSSIKGLFHLDSSEHMTRTTLPPYETKSIWPMKIKSAFYDPADNRYYFSLNRRLYSSTSFTSPGATTSVLDGRYNHIVVTDAHTLWLANDNGITVWQKNMKGGTVHLTEGRQVCHLQTADMITDYAGNMIVQIDGTGVLVFPVKNRPPYLISERTVQLIKYSGQGLWIVSGRGINYLTLHGEHYECKWFYPNIRQSLYDEAYDLIADGKQIMVSTKNGILTMPFTAVDYADSNFLKKPDVTIQYANKQYIQVVNELTVCWQKADLSFSIAIFSASYLGDVSYEYYLDGVDIHPHTTSLPVVSYPVLPAGTYTFHVRVKVNNLNIRSAEYVIKLTIKPRWWQSVWFRISIFILLAGVIFSFSEWRLRMIRRKEQYQSFLKNKAAQMELQALQSQINPHFIFNALGAVKSYFRLNRIAEAELLMEDFSELVRMYLEFSKHQFILLDQEIRALKIYTDIERRRFEHRFSVVFRMRLSSGNKVPDKIPSMILQPFVENAINHGLFRRKEPGGELRLFFLDCRDALVVVIDDNGIGRKRASEISSRIHKHYPSRGSSLVTDRINVLNEFGEVRIIHEIIDKYDHENNSLGTRVIIRFYKEQP